MAANTIRLSEEIMQAAISSAPLNSRSVPKQIEHWAKIGKIAEENPDLPYEFIRNALEARGEMERGDVSVFKFRNK
ncbi:MAG: ParD-like family protein [Leptospirales bacterium]|nr:ParD-like family protein [Leptospirales bacterium]